MNFRCQFLLIRTGCINARNQTESNTAGLTMLRGADLCFGESTDNRWFNLRQKQIGVSRTTEFEKHALNYLID